MLNQLTSMVKNICTPASRSSHDISLNSSVKRRRTTSTPVDEEDGAITRESKTSLYLNLITTLKKSSKQITFVIGPPTSTPSKRLGLVPLPTTLESPIVKIGYPVKTSPGQNVPASASQNVPASAGQNVPDRNNCSKSRQVPQHVVCSTNI